MPVKQELIKTSLRGKVVESAANTYTEATIDTNLSIRGDHIFLVTGIWWSHDGNPIAAGDGIDIQLCYAPQTGGLWTSDPDWFAGYSRYLQFVTSGAAMLEKTAYQQIDNYPIAVGSLYLGVVGTSLGAAVTAAVKIEGYHVKVNTTEYFRLAQSR